jgi:hypothetical protein
MSAHPPRLLTFFLLMIFLSPPRFAAGRSHEAFGGWSGPEGGAGDQAQTLRGRDRAKSPGRKQSSVRRLRRLVCGGAPGGAAPFAEGGARPRAGLANLPCTARGTDPRQVRKGPRKPLAPPGAPSPRLGEGGNRGSGVPAPRKQRPGPAERWLSSFPCGTGQDIERSWRLTCDSSRADRCARLRYRKNKLSGDSRHGLAC